MALSLGATTLSALYLGSTAISTAYLGSVQVYDAGGAAFDPVSLFASGEEGALFLPGPTTSFLSTTDLTPAGAGDTVGFQMDTSQGAGYSGGAFTGLGSELVTNGDFSTGDLTGWVASSSGTLTSSVVSGKLELVHTGSSVSQFSFPVSVVAGVSYIFSGQVGADLGGSAASLLLKTSSSSSSGTTLATVFSTPLDGSAASGEVVYTASSTTTVWVALRQGITNTTRLWDNISVRELPGNHATQGTAAARPVLARVPSGGRRNLLEYTEEFDNAYWTKSGVTVSANAATAPDTSSTADELIEDSSTGLHLSYKDTGIVASSTEFTTSIYAKQNTRRYFSIVLFGTSGDWTMTTFDLQAGTVTEDRNNDPTRFTSLSSSIVDDGDGWYRCIVTVTQVTNTIDTRFFLSNTGTPYADTTFNSTVGGPSYAGDGTSGIYIWGAQLEEASTASAYQKVVTENDVTEAGVDSVFYAFDDEVDDAINWTAPADTDYTISYVDTAGNVTTLTGQSLSGATDILLDPALVGYLAIDRALTAQEKINLESYLVGLAGGESRTEVTWDSTADTYTQSEVFL
jgi:hypothetical protein